MEDVKQGTEEKGKEDKNETWSRKEEGVDPSLLSMFRSIGKTGCV